MLSIGSVLSRDLESCDLRDITSDDLVWPCDLDLLDFDMSYDILEDNLVLSRDLDLLDFDMSYDILEDNLVLSRDLELFDL